MSHMRLQRIRNKIKKIPKVRYMRTGSCIQCGACCLNENCPHLKKREDGKFDCLIHDDPNRAEKCKIFPANPPIIFKTCGYEFRDRWEKYRRVKSGEV